MGSETGRDSSEVTQPTCRWQNGHPNPDGICLGFFLQPVSAGRKNSHLHCPKALMRSECFHFHSFTACYVGQEVSPFTARGRLVACPWPHSRPELGPLLLDGQEALPPWGLAQVSLPPAARPLSFQSRGAGWTEHRPALEPVGAGLAVGCLKAGKGVSQGMHPCVVTVTTPVASFFPLCSC